MFTSPVFCEYFQWEEADWFLLRVEGCPGLFICIQQERFESDNFKDTISATVGSVGGQLVNTSNFITVLGS